jgi:O-antigen/teichoic acid export membrane protein
MLVEVIATAAALLLGANPAIVATLMVATRLASLLASIIMLQYFAPWLHHGFSRVNATEIRRLIFPSVALLGIPAGNAAMIQGLIIILNHTIGSTGVVLFSTTRTLTRFALQLVSMFTRSSWPEISRLYGAGRADRLGAFLTHGIQIAAVITIGFALTSISGVHLIFKIWTGGRIEADRLLETILMFAVSAAALRGFPDTLIVATNRHTAYSGWFMLICLVGAAASYPASQYFGLIGAATVVAVTEVMLFAISVSLALKQIGQGITPLVGVLTTRPPLDRLLFTRKTARRS